MADTWASEAIAAVLEHRMPPPDPRWELCCSEARALRVKPAAVWNFKRRHQLSRDQPLSPDARGLLLEELEASRRAVKGWEIERAQALGLIAQRASLETSQAVAAAVPQRLTLYRPETGWVHNNTAENYLLSRVEALIGKRYATAGVAFKRAAAMAPEATAAAAGLDRFRLILFWGVVLRLDQLEGPPPADPVAFYRWSQLEAYSGHNRPEPSLGDLLAGRIGASEARQLLGLPVSGPLEPAAIRSAYRAAARGAHPDAGGDRLRFERLTAARERLMELA